MLIKRLFLGVALLLSASAYAQQQQPAADADNKGTSEVAQQINMAGQLIRYGYQTKSALPLIQAVQIYKKLGVTDATDVKPKESEGSTVPSQSLTKSEVVSYDETKILEDATTFASGNKNLLGLIADTKKASRGAVGGPRRINDCVLGNHTDTWTFTFRGGERASVTVNGDGDTDLDLYVYDENGNLIDKDDDYLDYCICSFTPRWTGIFKIKIVNRSRTITNCYSLTIN